MKPLTRRRFVQRAVVAFAAAGVPPGVTLSGTPDVGNWNGTRLDPAAIQKLSAAIAGHVVTPEAPDYEASRLIFNRAFDKRPALIIQCAGAADIARALEFAQRHEVPLAVRGGGHNRAGLSICDGGLVIDLSTMNRVEVNSAGRSVRAEGGALTVHVDAATQRFGLATTLAGCPTVGIAGLTLGGGEGLLMSKYGAACDNLTLAQLVTVDGRQVQASLTSNPDLFWAIRGGGGNFGVVSAFEYRLHPVKDVLAGTLVYPTGGIPALLEVFARVVSSAPDEFNVVGIVSGSAQGPRFQILVCHCGDAREAARLLSPLRALNPQQDTVRSMSYLEANSTINPAAPAAHFQTDLFVPALTAGVIETVAGAIDAAPPNSRVFMVPFYGAVTRVGLSDTAFHLRHPGYELDIMARWDATHNRDAAVQWVRALRDKLHPLAIGVYVNQLGETNEELVHAAYGPNYSRLVAAKKKYDPKNLLQSNQNIKPA